MKSRDDFFSNKMLTEGKAGNEENISIIQKIRNFFKTSFLKKLKNEGKAEENSDFSKKIFHSEEQKIKSKKITKLTVADKSDPVLDVIRGRKVSEIMIPRIDIIAVSIDKSLSHYIRIAIKSGFSRIPIYKGTIDDIQGFLYVKDLLKFIKKENKDFNVKSILRLPFVIPETMDLIDLFKKFLKNKIHMAVAVDEYGGTSGIVTLEDVIEEILGEIHDEYDREEKLYTKIGPLAFKVDARLSMEDVRKLLGKEFPGIEFDTIGGLLYDLFGKVPKVDEQKSFQGINFTILSLGGNRIRKIRIDL